MLAVSRHTADLLARESGLDPGRTRLLPPALAPELDALPDRGEVDEASRCELLSVARLHAGEGQKGVDHVIEVLPRLVGRHPRLRYRVLGQGSDKPRLVALARAAGLAERVTFEENLSDAELADRYRRAAAFVLPSGQEGFGIVFLEAMRFGRPCVGGDAGGTPEVIDDGRTGLLVPFGDRDALERALDRLLSDAPLRAAMGRAGLARVRELYVYERFRENVGRHLRDWFGGAVVPSSDG